MRSQKGKEQQREYAFLTDIKGVVHVGANRGSERHLYGSFNLDVLWVEADPRLFKQLKKNIKDYHRQKAVNALVSETDGDNATFYVASNNGASSSMLPMQGHSDMFPGVTVSDQIELKTATLKKIMHDNIEDPSRFDAPDQLVSGVLRCSGSLVHLRSIMASMNRKSSVAQTPKSVREVLTSDNRDVQVSQGRGH